MIENVTFRLRTSVADDEFLAADKRVQTEAIPNRDGFLRRTTARSTDGDWLVATLWASDEHAQAWDRESPAHPAVQAFTALVDPTSVHAARFTTLD